VRDDDARHRAVRIDVEAAGWAVDARRSRLQEKFHDGVVVEDWPPGFSRAAAHPSTAILRPGCGARTLPPERDRRFECDEGRIDVDFFRSTRRFDRIEARVLAYGSDATRMPSVARLAVCVSDTTGSSLAEGPDADSSHACRSPTAALCCAALPEIVVTPASPLAESIRILMWMGLPVLAGWLVSSRWLARRPDGDALAATIARELGRVAVIGLAAPLMLLVVWVAPLPAGKAVLLPVVGLCVHVAGGLAGWGGARFLGEPTKRHGVYLLGGACSNVLTFGSITIVFLLATDADPQAERALGDMAIYRLAEAPYYFLIVWPLAALISGRGDAGGPTVRGALVQALRSPTTAPLLGIVAGAALNYGAVERSASLAGVAQVLVRANVVALGLTVGLRLRRANPMREIRPCLLLAAIKFLVMPTVGVGLAFACGLDATTVRVIAICASMPVAFMAVVGAVIYRLDDELVSSFWLFTTSAMVVVVPILAWVVPRIATR